QTRLLGTDHTDTLHTRSQLAYWRAEFGDASRASAEYAARIRRATARPSSGAGAAAPRNPRHPQQRDELARTVGRHTRRDLRLHRACEGSPAPLRGRPPRPPHDTVRTSLLAGAIG